MKSYTEIKKKYSKKEIAESYIFPDESPAEDRESALIDFQTYRRKISKKRSSNDKLAIVLLQLRFFIEDYLKTTQLDQSLHFGFFLKEYISRLDKKNKDFAGEIQVDPTELSQIINKHRKPTEKIIYRLEIHSNRNFPATLWFKVLEKDRAVELDLDKSVIAKERPFVKDQLTFSL